jgi:cytochrome c
VKVAAPALPKSTASVSLNLAPVPAKPADAGKPVPAPKVLPATPVKTAEAKPAEAKPAEAKPAEAKPTVKAQAKEAIPGLRMSANAY